MSADNQKEILAAAVLLKENCDNHNFYANDSNLCEGCVFAKVGECCPIDGGGVPADWDLPEVADG